MRINRSGERYRAVELESRAPRAGATSTFPPIGCCRDEPCPPSELGASPSTSTVSITVLSVTPAHAKKLFAFASIELDIDGVQIEVHGIRAMREPEGTAIELPKFRDAGGVPQSVNVPRLASFRPSHRQFSFTVQRPQHLNFRRRSPTTCFRRLGSLIRPQLLSRSRIQAQRYRPEQTL
jgi:hypothetical protein